MQNTLVNDIETWDSPNPKDEGISLLKKNIKNFPKNSNIGFELGNESFLRMSIMDYQNIQKIYQNIILLMLVRYFGI